MLGFISVLSGGRVVALTDGGTWLKAGRNSLPYLAESTRYRSRCHSFYSEVKGLLVFTESALMIKQAIAVDT